MLKWYHIGGIFCLFNDYTLMIYLIINKSIIIFLESCLKG